MWSIHTLRGARALLRLLPSTRSMSIRTHIADFVPRRLSLRHALSRLLNNTQIEDFLRQLPPAERIQMIGRWQRIWRRLLVLGGTSEGNFIMPYMTGIDAFEAMWEAIREAEHSIKIETYIMSQDRVGEKTLELLLQAQRRGVQVTFLYDSYGSLTFWRMMVNLHRLVSPLLFQWLAPALKSLEDAGAIVLEFNPLMSLSSWLGGILPWRALRRSVLFRTHRKLLIVDDQVAFCGGMNIGERYAHLSPRKNFHDSHFRVIGPAVDDMIRVFNESFAEAQQRQIHRPWLPALKARALRSLDTFRLLIGSPVSSVLATFGIASPTEQTPDPPVQPYAAILIPSGQPVRAAPQVVAPIPVEQEDDNDNDVDEIDIIDAEAVAELKAADAPLQKQTPPLVDARADAEEGIDPDYRKNIARFRKLVRGWRKHAQALRMAFTRRDAAIRHSDAAGAMNKRSVEAMPPTGAIQLISKFVDPATMTPCDASEATAVPVPAGSLIQGKLSLMRISRMHGVRILARLATVLESNPNQPNRRLIQKAMRVTFRHAVRSISVTNPYFVPPYAITKSLMQALSMGVELNVIMASGRASDVKVVRWGAVHLYPLFLRRGAHISEFDHRMLHAKMISIDGLCGIVGSSNLEKWSFDRMLEVNLAVFDPAVVTVLDQQMQRDLAHSQPKLLAEFRDRSWLSKLFHWTCYGACRV